MEGFILGWLVGSVEVDGLSEGCDVGLADTLGDSDGWLVGHLVLVGLILGSPVGWPDVDGLSEG